MIAASRGDAPALRRAAVPPTLLECSMTFRSPLSMCLAGPLAAVALLVPALPAVAADAAPAAPAASAASITTKSGLVYTPLREGTGPSPSATDKVRVHYRGTFLDGREFDSSYKRGQPIEFPLNRVIKCWTEGVQMMKVGGKARFYCPPSIAYGARGTPDGTIPPDAPLQFEVELLGINGH
jgi:FKBP-type peptidyl-prolyl cis-trans isomerase FkpA